MVPFRTKVFKKAFQILNHCALHNLHKVQLERKELNQARERYENLRKNSNDYAPFLVSKGKVYSDSLIDRYRAEHENGAYKKYNWGIELKKYSQLIEAKNIFELGCGSARLREWCTSNDKNYRGIDLINPRKLKEVFTESIDNLNKDHLIDSEIIISSDFLEHLTIQELNNLLPKVNITKNLHCIALYDDNFSHKSVLEAYEWALLFSQYFKNVEILDLKYRGVPFNKKAVYISAS